MTETALDFTRQITGSYATILADPPWRFQNRTGKMAPEHKRLHRYPTMSLNDIKQLPVPSITAPNPTSTSGSPTPSYKKASKS